MIVELADRAGLTPAEFRDRLIHSGIGASGHGFAWLGRARALADQIKIENQGIVAGGVVGVYAADDLQQVLAAQEKLTTTLRKAFAAIVPTERGMSMQRIHEIQTTPCRVWHERAALTDPSGSVLGMGYKICVAVPSDAHQAVREIIDTLPSLIDGVQVWAVDWDEAPGREQF
jgi:hypothetical protein